MRYVLKEISFGSKFVIIFILPLLTGCFGNLGSKPSENDRFENLFKDKVLKVSYYADSLNGNKTASGEIYDSMKYTAAHKHLPFGTIVKVINLSNNRSVVVRINDRGPFVEDRELDLSKKAAEDLGIHNAGICKAMLQVVTD